MIGSRSMWCISRQRVWGVPIPAFYRRQHDSAEVEVTLVCLVLVLVLVLMLALVRMFLVYHNPVPRCTGVVDPRDGAPLRRASARARHGLLVAHVHRAAAAAPVQGRGRVLDARARHA